MSTPTEPSSADREYVVIKRGLFWRPEDRGYTSDIDDAGKYTREEALERVHGGEEPVTMELASKYDDTRDAGTWTFTERKGNECYGKNAIECLIHEAPQSNTVAIVALGGPHGTSAAPEAVRAQAQTICDALNRTAHRSSAVAEAVESRDRRITSLEAEVAHWKDGMFKPAAAERDSLLLVAEYYAKGGNFDGGSYARLKLAALRPEAKGGAK